jgi:hypothetical protein
LACPLDALTKAIAIDTRLEGSGDLVACDVKAGFAMRLPQRQSNDVSLGGKSFPVELLVDGADDCSENDLMFLRHGSTW